MMVHLHVHSHFSVLDGLGKPADIVKRAVEIGSPAIAITDHGSISSLPEFYRECKNNKLNPIIGVEFYVVHNEEGSKDEKRYHLTVWAKTWAGVQSIMSKLTIANEQFYKRPRITFQQALSFNECCIGTACSFGLLSHPDFSKILPLFIKKYQDDFYLEIMPLQFENQTKINIIAQQLCNNIPGLNVIATNDAHYVYQKDAVVHDTLLAIQTNSLLSSTSRFKFDTDELYIKSRDEMFDSFKLNHPTLSDDFINKSLDTTLSLADKCNIELPEFQICLPNPYEESDLDVFASKLKIGWNEKQEQIKSLGKNTLREYMDRLLFEIDVIKKKDFVRYFLIVEDMINWARKNNIMVGPARGSSAGSLVCWLLGITQVDPLRWDLYFERFLDIEREDYPDIDVDFQDDKRHLVFEYIRSKYGYDKTAQITTFGFLKSKSAFRDVCRVNGKDMFTVNHLSKLIDDDSSLEDVPEVDSFLNKNPALRDSVNGLLGTIRQQGCHAAGVVVSSVPLNEICVIEKRSGSDVCNWDKRECENFGLVKIDVLGLSTLSVLSMAKSLVKEFHGVDIDFEKIDLRDEDVLQLFKDGNTVGLFQFESKNMRKLLHDVNPDNFEQVTDCTALYRPGALGSGQTEHYVQIAKGEDYESYLFPELKPILSSTYGNILYQEQIMQIFNKIGGFTWAESNKMRKIIGKKLGPDEFEKHREHFVSGAVNNGVAESNANSLFSDMVSFALYSFNKCVSGDTILMKCASGRFNSDLPVREMYKIKNDSAYAKSIGKKSLRQKWLYSGGYGYGMSMCSDGRIRKNRIIDIRPAGTRPVYRVDLGDGITIDVTDNHKFPTINGDKMLSELSVGDSLYVCGDYEKTKRKYNFSNIKQACNGKKYENKSGFPNGKSNPGYTNGEFSKFEKFRREPGSACFDCSRTTKIEVHHIDGDRGNNDQENLVKLCVSCHKKRHYNMGRTKAGEKGYPVELHKIVSITLIGETDVWDIEMNAPYHNFVTSNKIVTCNSHAISYTIISWWCSYFKKYYPVEYFASVFQCSTKDDKIPEYIKECKNLGIEVRLPDINKSTNKYEVYYDDGKGYIFAPLGIIKNVGSKAVDHVLDVRKDGLFISMKNFNDRIVKRLCNVRVVESLKKAGAFETLGVGTSDKETRAKELAEYVPIWQEIPHIPRQLPEPIDKKELSVLYANMTACAKEEGKDILMPYIGSPKASVFVINKPQSNETKNLSKEGTQYIQTLFKASNLTLKSVYYSNPTKCNFGKSKATKDCMVKCSDSLRKEISIVKPKLIICMCSENVGMFTSAKPVMRDLHGKIIYSKEFNAYVLFSYSPQYLFYGDDKGDLIVKLTDSLNSLFNSDELE